MTPIPIGKKGGPNAAAVKAAGAVWPNPAVTTAMWLDDHPTDDNGFPLHRPPAPVGQNETPSATAARDLREYDSATAATGKGTKMTTSVQQYLQGADMSTASSQKAAYRAAGESASRDAAAYQQKAVDLRADAATMADKPGMAMAREKLNREAAAADVTAGKRRGAAAALHARADGIAG